MPKICFSQLTNRGTRTQTAALSVPVHSSVMSLKILLSFLLLQAVSSASEIVIKNQFDSSTTRNQAKITTENGLMSLIIVNGELIRLTASEDFPFKYDLTFDRPLFPLKEFSSIKNSGGTFIMMYKPNLKKEMKLIHIRKDSLVYIVNEQDPKKVSRNESH